MNKKTDVKTKRERVLYRCQHHKSNTTCSILSSLSPAFPLLTQIKHEKNQYTLAELTARHSDKQMMRFVVLLICCTYPVLSNCSSPWQHNFLTPAPPPPSCNPTWNAALSSFNPNTVNFPPPLRLVKPTQFKSSWTFNAGCKAISLKGASHGWMSVLFLYLCTQMPGPALMSCTYM